nr:hypothetical protein [Tanacetum cinerariifolium]
VALVSSANGSQSQDNTKNNRILRTHKKARETKLEDHPRKVKSSLNKASVVDSKATSSVIKSVSNVNSNLKCASCNGCLFSDNHDACVIEYINSVNASRKSKSAKKPVKRKVWKSTGSRKSKSVKTPVKRKASKTKSCLWHRRLSHLNFGAINHLARQGLVRGLSKLKFEKDHICSECAMGKSTKKTHKPKSEDTNQEKLYLLHMDLCGPMRVESVNGKKYILVIVDDYSLFIWVKFLRLRDETPMFIIKFLKMIQNEVVERRNRTLIEAARTMLIYAQAPLFLWVEAVATACFTQNRSIVRLRHGNTPENIGKLQPKADIGIFIGYAPIKKAFRIYNWRTRRIVKTIHVDFDELTAMASEQSSLGPALQEMIPGTISSGLVQKSSSSTSYVPPSRNDWDLLFQPLFDEILNPPPSVNNQAAEVIAPIAKVIPQVNDDSTGSPSLTTVDQNAPSPSKSPTPTETQSFAILQDVGNDNLDIEVAHMGNDPLLVEPKTYKEALTQACWIEAMQEELHEFERLKVWELVPRPDKVMVITLKWIYKVKL